VLALPTVAFFGRRSLSEVGSEGRSRPEKVDIVYIDKSGTIQQNGQFKDKGLKSRLSDKQEGIERQSYFESRILKENTDALDICGL
jgi:hypothetical protein